MAWGTKITIRQFNPFNLDTKDSVCERIYELLRLDELVVYYENSRQQQYLFPLLFHHRVRKKDQIFGFFQSIYYLPSEKSAGVSCCFANFLHCLLPQLFVLTLKLPRRYWMNYSILLCKVRQCILILDVQWYLLYFISTYFPIKETFFFCSYKTNVVFEVNFGLSNFSSYFGSLVFVVKSVTTIKNHVFIHDD